MADNTELLLGQIDGKLSALSDAVRAHVQSDHDRFEAVFAELKEHAKDINTAKGAKGALVWAAGGVAGAVSLIAGAAQYIFK